jgi:hypothetical protein
MTEEEVIKFLVGVEDPHKELDQFRESLSTLREDSEKEAMGDFAECDESTLGEYDLTRKHCIYETRSPTEPCWGDVRNYTEVRRIPESTANILTCLGHSRLPDNLPYYTPEDLRKAKRTGGNLHNPYIPRGTFNFQVPSDLEGLWEEGSK